MMAEGYRLSDLQVSVAGHHRGRLRLGAITQPSLQLAHRRIEPVNRAAQPEPQVGRDLVVARARGMQASRCRPDQLGKASLDVHMDVLALGAEDKARAFDLQFDL